MANTITNVNLNLPTEFAVPVQATSSTGVAAGNGPGYSTYADQTATTTVTASGAGDMRFACRSYKALVRVKTYVVGTATIGPLFVLEADSDSGMATALTQVAAAYGDNVASTTKTQSIFLFGMTPLVAGLQYVRLKVTLSGNATIAFDAIIEGT